MFHAPGVVRVLHALFRRCMSHAVLHLGRTLYCTDVCELPGLGLSVGDGKRTAPCSQVAKVNVHGYQYEGGRRDLLYTAVHSDGKALWNSEYGEDDASGAKYSAALSTR